MIDNEDNMRFCFGSASRVGGAVGIPKMNQRKATDYGVATIPAATDIDYGNVDEVCGYQLLLCKIFERAGGLDLTQVSNATIREVQRQGTMWLRGVRFLISGLLDGKMNDLAAMPDLLTCYDFFYRICNGGPCYDYLREVKLKTIDRWLKGNKTISDTDIALLILSETDRDIRSLDRRYSDYAFNILGEWVDELKRCGKFVGIPLAEACKRLVYLLTDDLFAYFGGKDKQDAAKAVWTKNYVLENHSTLNTRTLLRYISFLITANLRGYYDCGRKYNLYCRLWAEYISRPEVNPFFRRAMEIDLAKFAPARQSNYMQVI